VRRAAPCAVPCAVRPCVIRTFCTSRLSLRPPSALGAGAGRLQFVQFFGLLGRDHADFD
jgi:hypothetical protein